jgi:hypothetical protein
MYLKPIAIGFKYIQFLPKSRFMVSYLVTEKALSYTLAFQVFYKIFRMVCLQPINVLF